MRNRALNIGVAILALGSLPSCATDQAVEGDGTSEVGSAEGSSNDDSRGDILEAKTTTSLLGCGLNPYNDRTCYTLYNCYDHTVDWIIVKFNGGTTGCFRIQPGGTLSGCLASGRASHIENCPW